MIRCNICNAVFNSNDYTMECPICHATDWCDYYLDEIKKINSDEGFVDAMMKLKEDDPIEFQIKMKQLGVQPFDEPKPQQSDVPRCPTCNSMNVSKIGAAERIGAVALFGVFSKKINKTYKCNNCGHTW